MVELNYNRFVPAAGAVFRVVFKMETHINSRVCHSCKCLQECSRRISITLRSLTRTLGWGAWVVITSVINKTGNTLQKLKEATSWLWAISANNGLYWWHIIMSDITLQPIWRYVQSQETAWNFKRNYVFFKVRALLFQLWRTNTPIFACTNDCNAFIKILMQY